MIETAIVTIAYVQEVPVSGGFISYRIGADRPGETLMERYLGFSTLSQRKAKICRDAVGTGQKLLVKFKKTQWFDADLLHVELAKEEGAA